MMSTDICRWLFLLISLATWTTITSSKEMRVVCYYTNWSVYRPGAAKFNPQNINPYLCTHLIYAFGGFTKENTLKPFDKYQDIEKGGYAKFTGLKTYNKNLKTMLAIGGWNEGSSRFSPMVANSERRKELVKNTIKFLRQNHFDGLDLDWEYPTFRDGGKPRDRDNYAQLVEELREEFDRESEKTGRPRLLLTMAVPAGIEYINKGYDVPKLMKHLDWMNILSYDYHSAFEPAVNHHAPLFSMEEDNEYNYDAELNIDYTVKHYMKLGADPHKLILGIPTYGRSYTLYNPDAFEIGSPADGPGDMGEATRENGYLAYYEICDNIKNQGWEVEQPNPTAMGPYAFKDNQWVGYDDEEIVRKKSEYVAENGLGGIMFWAIDNDDFRGNCHGKPYPLIEAAKEALMNAYGLTDDNLISPPTKPKSRSRPRSKPTGKAKTEVEEEAKVEKVSNSGGSRRRNRFKSKAKEEGRESTRQKNRRKELRATTTEVPTTHSSLKVVTPSYTTPAPPSTPELDGAFKCEDEGFFPHPKDCKKYFWCLSGAGDSGIVAHQFTCPAGLYFNKAADSCDYTQNVLCNKKLQKPSTTTTASSSASTTPASTIFSTSRAPPKITAATSRTTFKVTTTTEAYEDDYEYEDEDDEEDEKDDKGKVDPEEDPRVIKELIELIKKAGGIEELEKQLSGSKTGVTNPSSDSTTPSGISKSLYERVLNKAVKNTLNSKKNPLTTLRNSRGPQNDGLSRKDESPSSSSKTDRGKLQYTSISRKRPSTEKSIEEDKDDEEEEEEEVKEDNAKTRRTFSKKFQPEYVTIRRPRVSSTTEATEADSSLNRNKILGETSDEEYDDDDDSDEDEDDDDDVVEDDEHIKKQHTPQYVNIRRQRPSTSTEESTTSKYTVIRRGSSSTTESASEANEETTTSKYKTIRRGSTLSPTTTTEQESSSSRFQLRRGTTASTTPSTDGATSRFKNFRRGSTTPKATDASENVTSSSSTEASVTTPLDDENDVTPRSSTVTRSSTETSEINTSGYQIINRSSTTTQPEIDTVATISASVTGPPLVTSTQASTTLSNDENNITTLANIVDDIITSEPSSTAKSEVPSSTSEQPIEIKKPDDPTETPEKNTSNSSAADATDNETETTQKNQPHLLDPRPFSVFSRDASSTVRSVTEPTIQNSKVSQSNFKFRLKPKTLDSHDTSSDHTSTSETPVLKNTYRFRNRGTSRFTSGSQNIKKHVEDTEEEEEEVDSKVKVRKRISTTEKYIEENRTFRPSELADLSSLTAVDFAKIKELNFGRGTHKRRGRPNTLSTVATTTEDSIEEVADESSRTSSRTLPLARKLIENSPLGPSRRIIPKKIDQLNSSSELNTTKKIRGFGSRTTRQPSTTESSDTLSKLDENPSPQTVNVTPRSRRVVRRFRTTTPRSVLNKDSNSNGKSSSEIQAFRRRTFAAKIGNSTEASENTTVGTQNDKQSPLQKLFSKKPTRLPFVIQKNDVDEDIDDSAEDSSTEEGENIKLSESNIRENSDVNSYDIGGKQRVFKLIRPKSDILHGKENTEKGKIESGKGALSITEATTTEKISENKTLEVSTQNSTEATSTEAVPEETTTENVTTTRKQEVSTTSTQPSFRTRKIIRKLKPTTATVLTAKISTTEPTNGRKRKVIRRLRPTSAAKNNLEISKLNVSNETQTEESIAKDKLNISSDNINRTEKEVTPKRLFRPSLTRPKSKYIKANVEKDTSTEATEDIKPPVRVSFRKLSNRNSTRANLNNDGQDSTKHIFRPKVSDLRSKYKGERKPFKPFVRSTTVKNEILNTTESTKNDTTPEQEAVNEETASEKHFDTTSAKSEDSSSTDSVQIDSISKQFVTQKLNILENNLNDTETRDSTETTNIIDNSLTTIKTVESSTSNYFVENNILTTAAEDSTNVSDAATEDSATTQFTEESDGINETTPNVEESKEEIGISTTLHNFQTTDSSTTEDNMQEYTDHYDREDENDNEDDEDASDEPGKENRNYISIFRSSSTSDSFKDFDSETDMDSPKFEDLFEDKDKEFFNDEIKFEDHTEYSKIHFNDDDDDFYKFDDDSKLVGDTSTEYKSGFSYSPNEVFDEITEAHPVETSSIKNKLYRPQRPSFIRPKITISTTERQTPRPKYKTFSRLSTKRLEKETIKINTFNDTDENGTPDKPVNKVLFSNRYKYKTLERTTAFPEVISAESDKENDTYFEDDSRLEGTTTFLHILNSEENIVTTQSIPTKSVENSVTESSTLAETTLNDESTATSTNLDTEFTTQLNTDSTENTFELTTVEVPTLEPEVSTITDSSSSQAETTASTSILSTTEPVNISEQTEQNSNIITASTDNTLEPLDTTTEIPSTTTNNLLLVSEYNETKTETTTVSPETTTPYRRRSTLKPINSRPKFTPIRRKNAYGASSTTEQREDGYKKKNKFYRNRYQKSTTESVTPDSSDISNIPSSTEKSTTSTSVNKLLHRYSTTRTPEPIEKDADIQEPQEEEDKKEIKEEKLPQYSGSYAPAFKERINNVYHATPAIPIKEYIFTHSTTEVNNVGDEEGVIEEASEDEDSGNSDDGKLTQEDELEENLEDKEEINTSSESSVDNYNTRLEKPKLARVSNTPIGSRRSNSPVRSNSPFTGRSTTARVVNRPIFGKTTENPKVAEDLTGIDTDAVKNRNKNLFSKHRKTNSPINSVSASSVEEESTAEVTTNIDNSLEVTTNPQEYITLSPLTTESVTKATTTAETTEYLTTLHHIFAEVKQNETDNIETTTESLNSSVTSTTGKIERLIEVNRIVQVQTKEAKRKNHVLQEQPTAEVIQPVLDKIGEINRITVIKVVDGNDTIVETINSQENEIKQTEPISPVYVPETVTTEKSELPALPDLPFIELPAKVEEVPGPKVTGNINLTDVTVTIEKIPELLHTHSREDRKYDNPSKTDDLGNNNQVASDKKTEIIDGMSHINVITPRAVFTEATTIALEGLFQTESTQPTSGLKTVPYDELLETEHSKFVNVRVLHPDENFGKAIRDNSKLLPIKLLKQDEKEVTLRAKVVEVRPKSNLDTIKIVPIKVEMSKRISDNLPVLRVTPQDTKYTEYT
ncbi:uncharacterized protein LOC108907948 [Anoplophora glabripennis]|uniref:uncharacterized protein LOC108907948 n=1 Tax=Anoplophora glabripennis TaxID=217634 RepID=UPI000874E2BF|nr:uncharacterized protein LOC108907948 [Anoplophora glabripennis]